MAIISKDLFRQIHRIHIWTKRLVDDLLAGAYKSAFKGNGIEFEEVREYVNGDDVRQIDWNVTSRYNVPYIKNFREERELTVMLVVDVSSSLDFGTHLKLKKELVAELSAALAFSAIKNNDKVGLILFSSTVEKYIAPKKGQRHVLRVIRELLACIPKSRKTSIKDALSFLGKIQRKSAVIFLISDFLTDLDFEKELKILSKKHDVVGIAISDPAEVDFPSLGLISVKDLENDKSELVDSKDMQVQKTSYENRSLNRENVKVLFEKWGGSFLEAQTDQSYASMIHKYFLLRKRRK